MAKTVSLRIDDDTYELLKVAADGHRRSLSNFIEFAAVSYLTDNSFISNIEMEEFRQDESLLKDVLKGMEDIKAEKYSVVK